MNIYVKIVDDMSMKRRGKGRAKFSLNRIQRVPMPDAIIVSERVE